MYPKLRVNPRGEACDLHLFHERRTPELAVIGYGAVFDCEGPQLRFKMGPQGREDCPKAQSRTPVAPSREELFRLSDLTHLGGGRGRFRMKPT
jgi:hypothetical protein